MTEQKKTCPKCDSDVLTDIGIDKTLMPRLFEDNYFVIGDFYQDIHILQCSNCGCRFLFLEPIGFVKSISTESRPNQRKKYQVGTISYKSFEGLTGTDKQNTVDKVLNSVVTKSEHTKKKGETEDEDK